MDRQSYAKWIREVRKFGKMNQEQFAKNMYQYRMEKNNTDSNTDSKQVCSTYHRNEIGHWEKGEHLPKSIETFLSIALLDFDQRFPCEEAEIDVTYRNRRYQYASEKMCVFLGRYLYCRNLHDILLVQVCRKVISFPQVLEFEAQWNERMDSLTLDVQEKQEYALKPGTIPIQIQLMGSESIEKMQQIIEDSKEFVYTGNRTLGERMKKRFEERERYKVPISFSEAVQVYAPNYRSSIQRIFKNNGITREWLIDLCIHLRFNREEIQYVLEKANLIALSDDVDDIESLYKENEHPIGSAKWYRFMETTYPERFEGHFSKFVSMTLFEKISIALLLCAYVEDMRNVYEEHSPLDYVLESFIFYDSGVSAMKIVKDISNKVKDVEDIDDIDIEELHNQLKNKITAWMDTIQFGFNEQSSSAKQLYNEYKNEVPEYTKFSEEVVANIQNRTEVVKLRYVASMLYTIFTGKYYTNKLSQKDLDYIKEQLYEQTENWEGIYYFLNQYFLTFLEDRELYPKYENKREKYYALHKTKKMTPMDMELIRDSLWESLFIL